ncbi:cbb3-type cytochrome oxidase assembly protein CcoS [Shimia sp. R11_0]|uniref:Cytochrome oxidase maturation protein, cbb3-type n=1 Tax=Shimia marina TaxID=321267 RepID=A0A0P1EQG9_9RHOB|nr:MULTISPECIES: cbb3-type cytochrome oxidase assembly protein CcoS [Shimia]MBO9478855.1 cbb3-type cytochrome oxidase assembly protein CcoS [Shimia sp. R11_0]CUH52385.1 cytochrome oxidase maturation protein, cbb3-type [Shimia marina]SFE10428.1 cytochrome oxidase maturation protein, cbb3-type [Shimia marina]
MQVLSYLIPISLLLGGVGLLAFLYTVRSNQYDDPEGDAQRILSGQYDDRPKQ